MADDELFQVKNHFYLGAYQLAINEATQSSFSEECKTELDCLIYRSYIGMSNFGVRVRGRSPPPPPPPQSGRRRRRRADAAAADLRAAGRRLLLLLLACVLGWRLRPDTPTTTWIVRVPARV